MRERLARRTWWMLARRLGVASPDAALRETYRRVERWRGSAYRSAFPQTFARDVRLGPGLRLLDPSRIRVEAGCVIAGGALLATAGAGTNLRIGRRTFLNQGVCLAAETNTIDIGEDVLVGPHALVVTATHAFAQPDVAIARQGMRDDGPVHIGDGSWIATGAVILGGTCLPARSVVAANAVVRGRFHRRCLLAGAPAQVVRYLDDEPSDEPDHEAPDDHDGLACEPPR